jgi:hypothetical protein
MVPAGPASAQPQQPTSGLAQAGWERPVATSLGVPAPAGGSFGGSASTAAPRSPSQPPGVYTAPAAPAYATPPQQQRPHSPSQPPYATPPQQQRPQSASQPNFAYGQAPSPNAQPLNPYAQQPPSSQPANQYPPSSQPASYPPSSQPANQYAQLPAYPQPANPYPQPYTQQSAAAGARPQAQQPGAYGSDPHVPRASSQSGPPPAYGPGGYPMVSTTPAAAAPTEIVTKPKKGKGLIIAIGAVVAIGAGVTIAVVMSGGKGTKGGLESRDEVAKDTVAALTKGDVDRLMVLSSPEIADQLVSCDEEGKKEREPLEKAIEKLREQMAKKVEAAKGLEVELVKLADSKPITMKKGDTAGKGCTLTTEIAMHDAQLSLKIKAGGKPARERTTSIQLMEAEGRWYLAGAPKLEAPGDCAVAAKTSIKAKEAEWKKQSLGDGAKARLEQAMTKHCTDDKWSDAAITCIEDAKGSDTKCLSELTAPQRDGLRKKFEQILLEDVKSREVPTVADNPPPPTTDPTVDPTAPPSAGSGSGSAAGSNSNAGSGAAVVSEGPEPLPPICDEYKVQIDKLAGCRRIKADIKKAVRESYDLVVEGWDKVVKKSDAVRTSTQDICKRGVDQLVDLRKSLCR